MATVWQLAKSIEVEGKKMYEELARDAPKREIAGVFSALAGEEQRHYELFDKLEKRKPIEAGDHGSVSVDIPKMVDAIRIVLLIDEPALTAMNDAETTYKKALVLENSSIILFNKIMKELTDEHQIRIVKVIIDEEKCHIEVIRRLIDFVHRPKEWLENAEVYHYDEY
ncbi:MAG: ferritin family protein [Chitinispirillaceae bacterium]|nr:ferritin family protein [Chitinispirillaceae bacterium]